MGWGDDHYQIDLYTTILATSSIVGICIGSLYGGDFIKMGRRVTIINFNIVGLIASLSIFTYNYKVMCFGRLIFGFSSGVLLCCTPKMIDETIPASLIDKGFGASTAIMMCFFQFVVMFMAIGMPDDKETLSSTYFWMAILGIQIPFQALAIILSLYIFTEEPLEFSIKNGNREEAMSMIRQIYSSEDAATHLQIF